jgi:hypothetical protein
MAALSAEVGGVGISPVELDLLADPRRRRRARSEMRQRAGSRAASVLRRLQREQVNLAMVRSKVASADDPILIEQRDLCRSLRDALQAMRGAAPAGG